MVRGTNFDLIVHRTNGDSFGYMCDWGEENASPTTVESSPPDLPVSTSTGVTQAGGAFSARDSAPPYPIEVNDWQDGAGQPSYDAVDASPSAYRTSLAVDVTDEGHFELGPRVIHFPDWWMRNKVLAALGTFWAAFVPDDADPRKQLRFLHRYTVTSVGGYLGLSTDTLLSITTPTDIPDLSLSETLDAPIPKADAACTMGDYLYCPTHNEVVRVTAVSGADLTVVRAQAGTEAASHDEGETWYGFDWTPVGFDGDPAQNISALASDGKFVYVATHDSGSTNGQVWLTEAKDGADECESFSTTNDIVALCYCGGYLYGAKDASTAPTVGWFNTASSNVYTTISLAGSLPKNGDTVALVAVGNFAYWVVSDGLSRSWVYRVQHSSTDLFELVAELPVGFVATSAISHLGNLYIGGYVDTLETATGDDNLPRYEGALYLVGGDSGVTRVVRLKNFPDEPATDTRVKGLSCAGPYIYILTNDETYVYDSQHQSWSHYADTATSTVTTETSGTIDWLTNGFIWGGTAYGDPDDEDALATDRVAWDTGSDGYVDVGEVVMDESSNSGYSLASGFHRVSAGKWRRWTIYDLPASQATLSFRASDLQSQAGCLTIAGTSKEVRVYLRGVYSGGEVISHRIGLGYMTDPDGTVGDYFYRWCGDLSPLYTHEYRVLFSSSGAKVYVDGALALEAAYDELRNVSGAGMNKVWWSVGWPGDAQSDKVKEQIYYGNMYFTADGAYPPNYAGATVTTGMKDIATANGVSIVPIPGNGTSSGVGDIGGWDYIDSKEIVGNGYLETSDSAFHMGSVDKYLIDMIVEHSRIQPGQTLTATAKVDDVVAASGGGTEGTTLTTVSIGSVGKRVRARVALTDDDPNRPYSERLRVYRITLRFYPANAPNVFTCYLNCREGVQCRSGRDWGEDPEEAIRHLFAAASSGELVKVQSLFTSDQTGSLQTVKVESVKLFQSPGDQVRYDKLEGTCQVRLRVVS